MPRLPNKVQTVTITVSTTPHVYQHLEALVATGLYGKNPADAAERLVSTGIKQLLNEGNLIRFAQPSKRRSA
ncbi:MAG: hypothetical protein HY300_10270 [Verrucomicrobia bacterium]|nr:hypothetical protein [Verrucomicrobiota bacterium]